MGQGKPGKVNEQSDAQRVDEKGGEGLSQAEGINGTWGGRTAGEHSNNSKKKGRTDFFIKVDAADSFPSREKSSD